MNRTLYWKWRFSPLSRPFYFLLNWIHVIIHAHEIALRLDDCMRALGQMKHDERTCTKCETRLTNPGQMVMTLSARGKLISESYPTLPPRKWRND